MQLLSLTLTQFRSYPRQSLDCGGTLQLFLGPNGSGKTNLLEAISILSLTKSCRDAEEQDLPHWGSTHYRVQGEAKKDDGETIRLEVVAELMPRRQKACFLNDVRVSVSALVGVLPTVTFLPEDLALFSGAPAERRRFLDQMLSQVSPDYLRASMEYQRILKQRNSLLRRVAEGQAREGEVMLWDRELVGPAAAITLARLELIETLNLSLRGEFESLGEHFSSVELAYEHKGASRDREGLEAELLTILAAHLQRDLILQSTTVGPHRDDWHLLADHRRIQSFGSRGQQRVAMLALLFLQVSYLEIRRGEKPIILLDDVFSELDDAHQSRLIETLGKYQVFLTSAHMPPTVGRADIWNVRKGQVERETVAIPA